MPQCDLTVLAQYCYCIVYFYSASTKSPHADLQILFWICMVHAGTISAMLFMAE